MIPNHPLDIQIYFIRLEDKIITDISESIKGNSQMSERKMGTEMNLSCVRN